MKIDVKRQDKPIAFRSIQGGAGFYVEHELFMKFTNPSSFAN